LSLRNPVDKIQRPSSLYECRKNSQGMWAVEVLLIFVFTEVKVYNNTCRRCISIINNSHSSIIALFTCLLFCVVCFMCVRTYSCTYVCIYVWCIALFWVLMLIWSPEGIPTLT
jgi:hypothetical protein